MNNQKKLFVKIEENKNQKPIVIPYEVLIILWGKTDLIGLYTSLLFLTQVNLGYIPQPQLAQLLGMSYLSYLNKRKKLEKLGLIKVNIPNHNVTQISITSDRLWGLIKIIRGSYKNYKTPSEKFNFDELRDYLENTAKNISQELKKTDEIMEEQKKLHNIYINNNNNNINNNINKKKKKTYPKEDYKLVMGAFKKYKGIQLMGPEVAYHLRVIKLMFEAKRTPKQIIDFMKWIHDNENKEQMGWMKTWTIWTVQKKIPEFLAGKLKTQDGREGLKRI